MSTDYDYYGRNIAGRCGRCSGAFRLPELNCGSGHRLCGPCFAAREARRAVEQERGDRAEETLLRWHREGPPWRGRRLRGMGEAMLRGKYEAWRARMSTYWPRPPGFERGLGLAWYCFQKTEGLDNDNE